MPVALDPNEVYRYVVSTDRVKEGPKPTLLFHFPTVRETRKIANLFDEADEANSVDEMLELTCEAIRVILCGWENFKDREGRDIPYKPEDIDALLTNADFAELRYNLLDGMTVSEFQKKSAAYSLASSMAKSAEPVTAASA